MCYVSLTSTPLEFHIEFKYIDKVGHFFAYFILMAWFAQLYRSPRARLFFVLFFISMGVILEILQGLGGVRFFEYYDMLANTFGVASAWLITKGRLNSLLLSFETQLSS
ncbi:MAG: VanZ family protein [Gammaproteobacteria bacterium]|nr:VanZ family protein [Gammaproteobacteria bacterium]